MNHFTFANKRMRNARPPLFFCLTSLKKLENLLSEDDHSYWEPPYWNIPKETFSLGRTELLNLIAKIAN